jgi:hypothetical protein
VEGFLFRFLNFVGSYDYIGATRSWHRYEIRLVRNISGVRSYRDSQGFRKYSSPGAYNKKENGEKLKVRMIDVPVYHYNAVRPPDLMKKKSDYFQRFWHDDRWLEENITRDKEYSFGYEDVLELFKGTHPKIMHDIIEARDWEFNYDHSKVRMPLKRKILHKIEKITGWRIGEYKNYILIK